MANIKLNLNEFNTYLQNNKIDFSAEQAKFDTIFKECNTITPDDGELKDDEMKNFLGKISGNLASVINKYINGNQTNEIQQVAPWRNEAEQKEYNEILQEAVKTIEDNQELLGLSDEEIEYIKNGKIESIEQGSARYDKGDDQLKFNINDLNKPDKGNFIKVLIHEATHASIKSCNNTKDEERKCETRAIQGVLKLYKAGEIDNFPIINKMLSELEDENSLNQFIEDWLVKCGYGDYPESPAL